jgi:flagellar protein FlgJ
MISPVASSANAAAAAAAASAAGFNSSPRGIGALPQGEQVKAAAGQFEAILLRQFIQESVGKIMGGTEGGPSGNVYGYMLTDILATKLAEGGGMGLGRVLEQQLSPRHPALASAPADEPPAP